MVECASSVIAPVILFTCSKLRVACMCAHRHSFFVAATKRRLKMTVFAD